MDLGKHRDDAKLVIFILNNRKQFTCDLVTTTITAEQSYLAPPIHTIDVRNCHALCATVVHI